MPGHQQAAESAAASCIPQQQCKEFGGEEKWKGKLKKLGSSNSFIEGLKNTARNG